MYASIAYTATIREALEYHEEKVKQHVAECIAAENFVKEKASLTYADMLYPFEMRANYNDEVEKRIFHTAIKFGRGQDVSDATAVAIGAEYLREMGFGDEPWLIYRHRDSPRAHIHLVSSMIDREGKWMHISKYKLYRSQDVTEKLARKYGLAARDVEVKETIAQALPKLHQGLQALYPAMNRILEDVVPGYRYTNLGELNAILRLHDMEASRGKENTLTYRKQGLHYHALKADGQPTKEYLAARRFPSRPTLHQLEKRFAENLGLRARHRESLATLVDFALAGKSLSLEALKLALGKRGVNVVSREDAAAGRQIWFIDHQNKTVFEGGALGKDYSFAALQKRLVSEEVYQQQQVQQQTQRQGYRHSM